MSVFFQFVSVICPFAQRSLGSWAVMICAGAAAQPSAPPPEKSAADLAHAQIVAAMSARPIDASRTTQLMFDAFRDYPADERFARLLTYVYSHVGFKLPESERPQFVAEIAERVAAAQAVPGLSDASWEVLALTELNAVLSEQRMAAVPDLKRVRALIDALGVRRPESRALLSAELDYVRCVEKLDRAAALRHLQLLAASPNAAVAERASGELRVRELREVPLELRFTAADGRAVDFARLRGKVVLIDFWGTWCRPCVAELPRLKHLYETYREEGFEIVGIAFENARLADSDSTEQRADKIERARGKLLRFAADHGVSWPQHFDGKFLQNEIGRRYNIRALPTLFVLGRDGRLVETDVRDEQLEALVKRLLGL